MRWIVWILLIFAAAVGLAILMRFNHGNVALFWPPYRVDLSVNVAVMLLLILFAVLHLVMLTLSKALDLPARVREYQSRRRKRRATTALRDSLLAFFEGRFGRAERLAQQVSADADLAGPAALVAARAAHRMREFERRDNWLASAQEESNSRQAYLVTAAELAVEDQNGTQALSHIQALHGRGARHIHTLRLALRAHEQNEQWDTALQVLRQLEKRDALHPAAVQGIRLRALRGLVVRHHNDLASLKRDWASLTRAERESPELIEVMAGAVAQAGDHEFAWKLLEQGLKLRFAPGLLDIFRGLSSIPARERLLRAEIWRDRFGDEPALMLTLASLCVEESLWGKAEEFYRLAQRGTQAGEAHYGLAQLYERIGRASDAVDEYRSAARASFEKQAAVEEPPAPSLNRALTPPSSVV